jgi:hypothetical protein
MEVYILHQSLCYESHDIENVFSTLESAKGASKNFRRYHIERYIVDCGQYQDGYKLIECSCKDKSQCQAR